MKIVTLPIQKDEITISDKGTHRIVCIDCSGSMYSELSKLRTHLKNKLPTMILPQDTLSIIWFSGRDQFGLLFENIAIGTLSDLSKVNAAIDRFLTAQGLTGFKQPLEEVLSVIKRSTQEAYTLHFMTDGYENQWSKSEVLKACANLGDKLASATFVEYGYYADSKMIQSMAEEVGGTVVMAQDFENYSETLNNNMRGLVTAKKIKVKNITSEFVVGSIPSGFVMARPDALGTVTLPGNTTAVTYVDDGNLHDFIDQGGKFEVDSPKDAAFMVSALIQRGDAASALSVASAIGDVDLYQTVENAFSKQDYAAVVDVANSFGTGQVDLFTTAPRNTNLIPDPNAYNVLTLLMDLAEGEGNYLDISHPDFKYTAIGGKRETVLDENGFKPVFTDKNGQIKAPIQALKFDENRPNISILVKREGTVSLPKNDHGFGESIDSFIWRNYAIVRDGIINVRKLPVVLSKATHDLLSQNGVITEPFKINKTYVIDTKKLPIINRSMVTPMKMEDMFRLYFEMYKLQVKTKILGASFEKPEVSASFETLYGAEGAEFLKTYGVGPGGFGPKSVKGESVDPYVAKILDISMSGLNSIPKIEDVKADIVAGKKLTPSKEVVAAMLKEVGTPKDPEGEFKKSRDELRAFREAIVKRKFGIILGKVWFSDATSIEDNERLMNFGLSKEIKCTAKLEDREI